MATKSVTVVSVKPDLRSPKGTRIQRGLPTRVLRILTLILLDVISLTLAWKLAVFYGTPLESHWTQEKTFLLLTLAVGIGTIASKGLYQASTLR